MPLETLKRFDSTTANTILAAAALATTPQPGLGGGTDFARYEEEAAAVISEIRQNLRLKADDNSVAARARIDSAISSAFDQSIFHGSTEQEALKRAGNAGRLSPGAYQVIQPDAFRKRFYGLAITKQQIKEAVNDPDDFQHLMTENALPGEDDLFSIFMKQSGGSRGHAPNWLLVTSLRRGLEQIAQSAWRVYPDDVDLNQAFEPIHVLAAFAEKFGTYVTVGGQRAKFIKSVTLPRNPVTGNLDYSIDLELASNVEHFSSWSLRKTTSATSFTFGLLFAIAIPPYRESLRRHGAL
jgi:hypothetical protein